MSDLLQSQIRESCRLALPEGLKDLMSDISREVLRAQPTDLMRFIADYLSALLVTRENLTIASRVCADICSCGCQPELEGELRNIGLFDEEVVVATEIIMKHIYCDEVHEANILRKVLKHIDIDEDQLVNLQKSIRNAFIRHQANHTTIYESSSESDKDEIDSAVRHTLKIYKKTRPSDTEYEAMAEKIQASYRSYGVKRYCQMNRTQKQEQRRANEKNVKLMLPGAGSSKDTDDEDDDVHAASSSFPKPSKELNTVSSTSLAGSYLYLPRYKPYSVHDSQALEDLEETPEKEHANIDYTAENPHLSITVEEPLFRERKISFQDEDDDSVPEVIDYEVEIHDDVLDTEQVAEEVGTDQEMEVSEINDENVVAIDLDLESNGTSAADKSVKSDSTDRSSKDDDDIIEYEMHKDLSDE